MVCRSVNLKQKNKEVKNMNDETKKEIEKGGPLKIPLATDVVG